MVETRKDKHDSNARKYTNIAISKHQTTRGGIAAVLVDQMSQKTLYQQPACIPLPCSPERLLVWRGSQRFRGAQFSFRRVVDAVNTALSTLALSVFPPDFSPLLPSTFDLLC